MMGRSRLYCAEDCGGGGGALYPQRPAAKYGGGNRDTSASCPYYFVVAGRGATLSRPFLNVAA